MIMATFNCIGLLGLLWAVSLSLSAGSVASFPSLFSRSLLFQRGPQQQPKPLAPTPPPQQPLQPKAQQESLLLAANSIAPKFGALELDQNDLLRLGTQPNDAELVGRQHRAHHHLRHHNQQHNFVALPSQFSHAYFKPQQIAHNPNQGQQLPNHHHFNNHQGQQQQQAFNALGFASVQPVANLEESTAAAGVGGRQVAFDEASVGPQMPVYGAQQSGVQQQRQQQQHQGLTSSQSEVIDKIEQHIGDQIDQGLSTAAQIDQQRPAASNYQPLQPARGGASEKEAAASGEGEIAEGEYEGGPATEKRDHENHEQKEPSEHHHHQQHHGHENQNSFEVHHKKGGKSFQYFHQGHRHHSR